MHAYALTARIIGLSQLVLGGLYLAAPLWFVAWQGLTPPAPDAAYPLAMLGARFLVYGFGMFVIARDPVRHIFWARGMIAIQVIDLAAGLWVVFSGIVALEAALLPIVNAAIFAIAQIVTLGLSGRRTMAA